MKKRDHEQIIRNVHVKCAAEIAALKTEHDRQIKALTELLMTEINFWKAEVGVTNTTKLNPYSEDKIMTND